MQSPFKIGDKKYYSTVVKSDDTAKFQSGQVHAVYSTFALGRDAEWACRLFVLEMKDKDEEGMGTFLRVEHVSPAVVNESVYFVAEITVLDENYIECKFEAKVGDRLIAKGEQGQKIMKKLKIQQLFDKIAQEKNG